MPRGSLATALIVAAAAVGIVYGITGIEVRLFAQAAARIAALFTGAPVIPEEEGWALPLMAQHMLVNASCSGTAFFIVLSVVLGWQLGGLIRPVLFAAIVALLSGMLLTFFINGLRIVCLAQLHHWVVPRLPESYGPFLHTLTGVAIFLPFLILVNICLSAYAGRNRNSTRS